MILKPCPFCGVKPHVNYDKEFEVYWVSCYNKKCMVDVFTDDLPTEKRAVNAWNKRRSDVKTN